MVRTYLLGYNYRMDELSAALGAAGEANQELMAARQRVAVGTGLNFLLSELPVRWLPLPPQQLVRLWIRLDRGIDRNPSRKN